MSLYNKIFDPYPEAALIRRALVLEVQDIPRYRDAFFDDAANELVIYTRTGGKNRLFYDNAESRCALATEAGHDLTPDEEALPYNDELRKHPDYLRDYDCAFDSTFAYFHFRMPFGYAGPFAVMREQAGPLVRPSERWRQLLADLEAGKETPLTQRSLALGKQIFSALRGEEGDAPGIKIIKV